LTALGKIGGFDLAQDMLDLCLRMIIAYGFLPRRKSNSQLRIHALGICTPVFASSAA